MRASIVPLLACPRAGCAGGLSLDHRAGPPVLAAAEDPDEVVEGALACSACRTAFPILSGVGILWPEPGAYLRRYYSALRRDLEQRGTLSAPAARWLTRQGAGRTAEEDYGADFRYSQQFEPPERIARLHAGQAQPYRAFGDWLEACPSPYGVLADWASELPRRRDLLLDAGCGGGGLLARLAPGFRAAFGVDASFLAVLLARRAVLHRPAREATYLLATHRGGAVERPLAVPAARGGEFLVADCCSPPFPDGLFDAVVSCNVLDLAGPKVAVAAAARMLRPGGVFLLANPFYYSEGAAPPGEPREHLCGLLAEAGLDVEREQDGVPWTWATYERHWHLYFTWCAAARARAVGPDRQG